MIQIALTEIEMCISNALESKKKNILFISPTLEYNAVLDWLAKHPDFHMCRQTPSALYEERNGILSKNENYMVIDTESLEKANAEKSIWFHHAFSEKSILNFDGFLDIIRSRFYVNRFPGGRNVKHSLENMALFIAFTTPHNENDWAALHEKYYNLFDEIYLVE